MTQIIECPDCSTRYKINKAIPEGGRSVKCARCAHQWKLLPEDAMPDEDMAEDPVSAQAEHQWQDHGEAAGVDHGDPASVQTEDAAAYEDNAGAPVDDQQWTPLQADEYPLMNQYATTAHNDPEGEVAEPSISGEEPAISQGGGARWQHEQPSGEPDAGNGRAYPMPSGAYEVPSEIYGDEDTPPEDVAASDRLEAEETSAFSRDENWSSRFMGPGWRGQKASPPVEEEEDEDPESVIRETFRTVLERTDEEEHGAAASSIEDTEPSNPYGSIYDAEWNQSGDQESYAAKEASDEMASGFMRGEYDTDALDIEEEYHSEARHYNDEASAMREKIERFTPRDGSPLPYSLDEEYLGDYDNEPSEFVTTDEPENYTAQYDGQFDQEADRYAGVTSFDETLVGLHDNGRLDEVNEAYPAEHQNRSGLAIAAGWVAFLSLAGGLVMGVVNFRQDVMVTLPGTVNMYRMLGYEVELNKVDFASVDYKWSEIDGRPAIELRGEVVNVTDETVKVPPVLVNVQSTSGEALKAEASVPADELGPRDSATFTLELVSPPEDVSRIELEFAPRG